MGAGVQLWPLTKNEAEAPMGKKIVPLIMCGGAGTRLWPASREVRPKQFLPLFGRRSTFQETILRVSDTSLFDRPIVITNNAYRFMVSEQLAEIGVEADILLEPMRRDSGPALAKRSCWRSPPIMSFRTMRRSSPPAVRDWSQPIKGAS